MRRSTVPFISLITFLMAGLILSIFPFAGFANANPGTGDVLMEALQDEATRSMKSLHIEKMEKPSYLAYTVTDSRRLGMKAVFGFLTQSLKSHIRWLRVDLRVGDYQLDNSGFINRSSMFSDRRIRFGRITNEDDYNAVRRDLWLQTDKVYKAALQQMASKRAFIKNQAQPGEIADFSKVEKLEAIEPRVPIKMDRKKWEAIVKNLSGIFRKFPAIHNSGVQLQVDEIHKYFVNSEGTITRQPVNIVMLVAYASTQAKDGMRLKHHIPFYSRTLEGLPDEKKLAAGIAEMALQLTQLSAAPVLDKYIGPVMFTGQASSELFTQLLGPHLSGERPPLLEDSRMSMLFPTSQLARRLNRTVLPREISVSDDPLRTEFNKKQLMGSYKVDAQGVAAAKVQLVEEGVLKSLLMSRQPREEIKNSNGHCRASPNRAPGVFIGNLFITAQKGKTLKQLKKELIDTCKSQNLPFGLLIKTLDIPSLTASDVAISPMNLGRGRTKVTAPVMLYKVYIDDGREELVRGISFGEISVKTLKDIIAVGSDSYVHHRRFSGSGMGTRSLITAYGRGTGIPGSIIAPSIIIEELEFKKETGHIKNPPLLVHPFFR